MTHVHNRLWVWHFDPLLLALLSVGVALGGWLGFFSRRTRLFATITATTLTALAVIAFGAGIDQRPGPGEYQRHEPQVERSSELILTTVEIDHFHAPTDLEVHWLIAGLCLALLAIPPAKTATAPRRDKAAPAVPA